MIVCEAIPFGFGPVAKLLALAEGLARHTETMFIGSGCSWSLASRSPHFCDLAYADTMQPSTCTKRVIDRVQRSGGVISVMNPTFAAWAVAMDVPTVVVDSLFQMWDKIPPPWHEADAVLLQQFDDVEHRVDREFRRPGVHVVGPILATGIVSDERRVERSETLLINLGGSEDPISKHDFLCATTAVRLLSRLPALQMFKRKVLAIGPKQRPRLKQLELEGIEVKTLSHGEFLHELTDARLLCTTPGLTATFESFATGTPCVFLPPFNYSQFLNLLTLRARGVAPLSIHWNDYGIAEEIGAGMPESTAVHRIEDSIRRGLDDPSLPRAMRRDLSKILNIAQDPSAVAAVRSRQCSFFTGIGGCGTQDAVDHILGVLRG